MRKKLLIVAMAVVAVVIISAVPSVFATQEFKQQTQDSSIISSSACDYYKEKLEEYQNKLDEAEEENDLAAMFVYGRMVFVYGILADLFCHDEDFSGVSSLYINSLSVEEQMLITQSMQLMESTSLTSECELCASSR